jgi:IS30 family transposase
MSFSAITEEDVAFVEKQLNTRPRKCLGFATPLEEFERLSKLVA